LLANILNGGRAKNKQRNNFLITNTTRTVTCTSKVKEYSEVNIACFGHVSRSRVVTMRDNCVSCLIPYLFHIFCCICCMYTCINIFCNVTYIFCLYFVFTKSMHVIGLFFCHVIAFIFLVERKCPFCSSIKRLCKGQFPTVKASFGS
jgi:hypothetical protein